MNNTEIGEENLYYEMDSKQANDVGIYDDVVSESTAPATKQAILGNRKQRNEKKRPTSSEPVHSCQAKIIIDQRLLCILTAAVAVSFLTAAATFILALTMMMSRNSSTAATDCASVQVSTSETTNQAGKLEEIKKNISYMVSDSVLSVMAGVWVNMTSTMNELRQNQILTMSMSERQAVNVTQLESGVQELKKTSGNMSSRVGSLERGFTQMNGLMKTLQAVNAAQNASHEDLQSLYKRLNDSLATINATLNYKSGKANADFRTCQHKKIPGTPGSVGSFAYSDTSYIEPSNKRTMGIACSTDYAREYNLSSPRAGTYTCACRGVSPTAMKPSSIQCFLHVWECALGSS